MRHNKPNTTALRRKGIERKRHMKKITGYIGQSKPKNTVNGMIGGIKRWQEIGEPIKFLRPLRLTGPAGMGKTQFAEVAIAEAIGWQLVRVPAAAGIRDLEKALAKLGECDDVNFSAVPAVVFCDEAHSYCRGALNLIKTMTEGKPGIVERQGSRFVRDLSMHLWVFASNEPLDRAIESRSDEIRMMPYNRAEKAAIIEMNCPAEIDADAMQYLVDRVKHTARDCKAIACNVAMLTTENVTLDMARDYCRTSEIWPEGYTGNEVKSLAHLAKQAKPSNKSMLSVVLENQGSGADRKTTETMDYFALAGYVHKPTSASFVITEAGRKYLKAISDKQKAK